MNIEDVENTDSKAIDCDIEKTTDNVVSNNATDVVVKESFIEFLKRNK